MRSIGEVPPHETTGHQNWPDSYAEYRANVVQVNACVLDSVCLEGLPDTGEPSHSDIGTHGEVFYNVITFHSIFTINW